MTTQIQTKTTTLKQQAEMYRVKIEGDPEQNIKADQRWVEKAIVAIFEYQTSHEQTVETTEQNNGVGFTGADAFILSSFAKQIKAKGDRKIELGQRLSAKQMAIATKKMGKYAGQLTRIVNKAQEKPA